MNYPVGSTEVPPLYQPYDPDGITAFHAARLLLLIEVCGGEGRSPSVDGSTKLAKLDFFLRYPAFLERAQQELRRRGDSATSVSFEAGDEVEAPMIRYRFGPWDPRYRDYVSFLEARGLLKVTKGSHGARKLTLTAGGRKIAKGLLADASYGPLKARAEAMVGNLATWQGSALKNFIYELLVDEVGNRAMGEQIR